MNDYNFYAMLINAIVAIANAIVAVVSLVTLRNYFSEDSRRRKKEVFDARSRMYIEFQSRFRELQSKLPAAINDENFSPTPDQKRLIRIYWYMVFDEWFACNMHDDLRDMWSYYARGVESGLDLKSFRDELISFYLSNPSLFGLADKFFSEISEIMDKKFGRKLSSYKLEKVPA